MTDSDDLTGIVNFLLSEQRRQDDKVLADCKAYAQRLAEWQAAVDGWAIEAKWTAVDLLLPQGDCS